LSKVSKDDFKFVFSSEEGKRVLSHICRECGVLRPSFVPGEALENTAFNEGMRNVALMILTSLDETPERFLELSQEIEANA
jgi:hypothetical protein|tara:strand:- start:822 stop:1064 length:243 start_codon:yes stop_codon:yes gene_type:complete